jgi:hypothetical protein
MNPASFSPMTGRQSNMLAVLEELRALGVQVISDGGNLVICPASKVPTELKERLRAAKAEVLAALARPTVAGQPAECRHCEGKGKCDCPACTLRRTNELTPCSMCRWADHRLWVAASRPEACWHCGGKGKCGCIACNPKEPCRTCGGSGKASWIQ